MRLLLIILTGFLLFSCTPKVYFTPALRAKLEAQKIPLTKLHFYTDRRFKITHIVENIETEISSGKLRVEDGKKINIILLRKRTPGAVIKVYKDSLFVSFEDDDRKFLVFVPTESVDSPYEINYYSENGDLTYDNRTYTIQKKRMFVTKLRIKKNDIEKYDINKRRMKGRKID